MISSHLPHAFICVLILFFQATLHKNVLHMAGQLGLDPPTMNLCSGGPLGELEQALQNSEAVAKAFGCSISTSAMFFIIYCSANIPSSGRGKIQDKLFAFLKQIRSSCIGGPSNKALDPIVLYALVPNLPKRYLNLAHLCPSLFYFSFFN